MIALATLLSLAANNHVDNPPTSLGVIFIAIISLFSVTYFIGLHGDLAEGIYISVIL